MTVLTYLLGGGNSFSSGGPGKGMHSRLYTRVLNYHHWVNSCSSFSNTLNNTGLMGIQASCEAQKAQHMLDVMCGEACMSCKSKVIQFNSVESASTASSGQLGRHLVSWAC